MKVAEQYRAEAMIHKQCRDERVQKAKEALQKGRTGVASYYLQMVSEVMEGLIHLIYKRLTFMTGIHGFHSPCRNGWYRTMYLLLTVVTLVWSGAVCRQPYLVSDVLVLSVLVFISSRTGSTHVLL
jgi:hypothetical protein